MNSVLGNVWHLLNPILSIATYFVIFGIMLQTDRGVENFLAFLAIGVFVYQFTQKSTVSSARSLARNHNLIRSINFPRALVVLTTVFAEALAFLPGVVVFLAVAFAAGESPTLRWLALVPLFFLQIFFNAGIGFVAARANHAFRDLQNFLPFMFRLLFYGSGILFSVDAYLAARGAEEFRWLFYLNPIFDLVELYRWAVLGTSGAIGEVVVLAIMTMVSFVFGFAWFRRAEATYGA